MNKAILIGNLTRDPEVRTTPSGVSCCSFTVACTRPYANQQGVREADFINCVAWRQTGDFISRFFSKGKKICVEGSIQTRTYDAQDGTKRYVTEVLVDKAEFVESRGSESRARDDIPMPPEPPVFNGGSVNADAKGFTEVEDDELPF